jgi:hypothetical protein
VLRRTPSGNGADRVVLQPEEQLTSLEDAFAMLLIGHCSFRKVFVIGIQKLKSQTWIYIYIYILQVANACQTLRSLDSRQERVGQCTQAMVFLQSGYCPRATVLVQSQEA